MFWSCFNERIFFFLTTLFAFGSLSYGFFILDYSEDGDFFTLSIWMSLQIFKLLYFLRTKCPKTFIGNYLNQWALDIGCTDASEQQQNIKPSQNMDRTSDLQENENFQHFELETKITLFDLDTQGLSGQCGIVKNGPFPETGRYGVHIDGVDNDINIKPENMRIAVDNDINKKSQNMRIVK